MRSIILSLVLCLSTFVSAAVTKGTSAKSTDGTAASTTCVTGTFSAVSGAVLIMGIVSDDNGSSTHVTGVTVGGSPTYSTAWAKIDSQFSLGNLDVELWAAVLSSTVSTQSLTATISSSEKTSCIIMPYTGEDTATPIPAHNSASGATVNVTSSGNNNSLYMGFFGCGTNSAILAGSADFTAGSGYTLDNSSNMANASNQWTHGALETGNAAVTPAATTTVAFTSTVASCNALDFTIGAEIKVAGGGGATSNKAKGFIL